MKKLYVVIIAGLLLASGFAYNSYNRLMTMNENIDNKLAQIEVQLQNKSKLIPELADSLKDYVSHESKSFADVAEARAKLMQAKTITELNLANQELDAAVDNMLNLAETYPELKADEAFQALQHQLEKTNEQLAADRMDYNAYVQKLNARIKSLPDSLFAGPLGVNEKDCFKEEAGTQNLPEINY